MYDQDGSSHLENKRHKSLSVLRIDGSTVLSIELSLVSLVLAKSPHIHLIGSLGHEEDSSQRGSHDAESNPRQDFIGVVGTRHPLKETSTRDVTLTSARATQIAKNLMRMEITNLTNLSCHG